MFRIRINPESLQDPFKYEGKYFFKIFEITQLIFGIILVLLTINYVINRMIDEGITSHNIYSLFLIVIPIGIFVFAFLPVIQELLYNKSEYNDINQAEIMQSFNDCIKDGKLWRLVDINTEFIESERYLVFTFQRGLLCPCVDVLVHQKTFNRFMKCLREHKSERNGSCPKNCVEIVKGAGKTHLDKRDNIDYAKLLFLISKELHKPRYDRLMKNIEAP
ncbi:MAG: hypothetical protein DRN55_08610 [Thermoplasmata archaeon]|nr:MAG: hypothetical protein DRN55_08610 [Thermoplasmata archaeon]